MVGPDSTRLRSRNVFFRPAGDFFCARFGSKSRRAKDRKPRASHRPRARDAPAQPLTQFFRSRDTIAETLACSDDMCTSRRPTHKDARFNPNFSAIGLRHLLCHLLDLRRLNKRNRAPAKPTPGHPRTNDATLPADPTSKLDEQVELRATYFIVLA